MRQHGVVEYSLRVGDRVRIRLNPSCDLSYPSGSLYDYVGLRGHPACLEGVTGHIEECNSTTCSVQDFHMYRGHPFKVHYDRPQLWVPSAGPEYPLTGAHYALDELELLGELGNG